MGRPLNKKYFGNRNTGSASTADDDGIGGGFVASVTLTGGSLGAYTTRPTVTFSAPDKAALDAVTATGTVTSEALSAVATVAGNGYNVGDLLTVTTAGGTAVFEVATLDGGAGSGVATVTVSDAGSFTTLAAGAQATTNDGSGDDNATLTITYQAQEVVITEPGSGYTDATDAAPTFTQSVAGTTVLGVDSGVPYATGNQENAVVMTAFLTGGSALTVDVIKQVSTDRYRVTDGTRTGIVQLKASAVSAAGEASIVATDSDGGTYYVTKLTAHKATVTRGTGVQFATDAAVQWTFGTPTEDVTVKVANA